MLDPDSYIYSDMDSKINENLTVCVFEPLQLSLDGQLVFGLIVLETGMPKVRLTLLNSKSLYSDIMVMRYSI